jgi:hypothetical protein
MPVDVSYHLGLTLYLFVVSTKTYMVTMVSFDHAPTSIHLIITLLRSPDSATSRCLPITNEGRS